MPFYTRKPVTVQAFKWNASMGAGNGVEQDVAGFYVRNSRQKNYLESGDYVIIELDGASRCKAEIFEAMFELLAHKVARESRESGAG